MHNEIFEAGQFVTIFDGILDQLGFEKVVLLVSPEAPSYIHRAHRGVSYISYDVQLWNYKNSQTGKVYRALFSLGIHRDTVQVHVNSSTGSTPYTYTYHFPTLTT